MPSQASEAFVWLWPPGATAPVVCGIVQQAGVQHRFAYASSYLERPDAVSLYEPELPLHPGWIEPPAGLTIAGTLRDAGPDAWGQRVIIEDLYGDPDRVDPGDVDQITYFLSSGSNRIGALDFQSSSEEYIERCRHGHPRRTPSSGEGSLRGSRPGTRRCVSTGPRDVGGRSPPKLTIIDEDTSYVAKLSVSTDPYPVVKAEAVGLELARRVGIDVPASSITRSLGHDVLLVERFDRPGAGRRRLMVSGLTMLGLDEMAARYATYPDLLDVLRRRGSDPRVGERLFERIVFNIAIGNNDDHARNHAAFWDGAELTLTPAYDLCPQARSGETSGQAMAIDRKGVRESSMRACVDAATSTASIEPMRSTRPSQIDTIAEVWDDVADGCRLTAAERNFLRGRQILNPSVLYDLP